MKPIVVVVGLVAAATVAHLFMGNLIPEICGIVSIVIFIDVYLAAKEDLKKTSGDRGAMYFRALFGGLQKTAVATVTGAISIGWAIWRIAH